MSEIQFHEESEFQRPAEPVRTSIYVRAILATGLVSTERRAEIVVIAISIIGILASAVFLYTSGRTHVLSETDIQRITALQKNAQPPAAKI